MSTRISPTPLCPCMRNECRNRRRAENFQAAVIAALIVVWIFACAGIYLMIGA